MEIKVWVLLGAVGVMGAVIAFVLKVTVNLVITRLDSMLGELQRLNMSSSLHAQDIKNLQEVQLQFMQRLNNHAERLRDIEIETKAKPKTR